MDTAQVVLAQVAADSSSYGFTAALTNLIQYILGSAGAFFQTLDIGLLIGIVVVTNILKATMARYEKTQEMVTNSNMTIWLLLVGAVAGWVVTPDSAGAKEIVRQALYYAGGSTILFMALKHVITPLTDRYTSPKISKAIRTAVGADTGTKPRE